MSYIRMSPAYRHLGTSAVPEFDFGYLYIMAVPKYFGMAMRVMAIQLARGHFLL